MKYIKIDKKDYVLSARAELDVLLDEANAPTYISKNPPLSNSELSPTECRFIESLRKNVKKDEKIIVRQIAMDGISVSVFRFHLGDIGGK